MPAEGNEVEYNLTSSYGECIAIYCGEGMLTLQNEQAIPCSFEAGQLRSGSDLIICRFSQHFDINIPAHRFDGRTIEGFRVLAIGDILFLNAQIKSHSGITATLLVRELVVRMSESARVHSIRFGIANFLLAAPITLELKHAGSLVNFTIDPVKNYGETERRLQVLKSIDVTCEVVGDIRADGDEERMEKAVDNLCYLLSVARGTKIQWIYCDRYDEKGILTSRRHGTRVTKVYCPLELLGSNNDRETRAFVEETYGAYVTNRARYELDGGTIDAYLDAKAENDYLELRGIKLSVAIEALKAVFLKLPDPLVGEYILKEEGFKSIRRKVEKYMRNELKAENADSSQRDAMCRKLPELNRRPFKDILIGLFDSIQLNVDSDDLNLFVKCRDSLVHQGRFYCQTATPEERVKVAPLSTVTEEYYFLVHFVDRVFLKLLGYRGPYFNMRSPGNPVHQEQV
jgi:hypothetical protein